jgi:hypothetical protein
MSDTILLSFNSGVGSSGANLLDFCSGFFSSKPNYKSSSSNYIYSLFESNNDFSCSNEVVGNLIKGYADNAIRNYTENKIHKSLKYSEILGCMQKLKAICHDVDDAPSMHAIEAAEYFIVNYIAKFGLESPSVNVLEDGEITFYWKDSSKVIDLTVEDNETYSFYAKKKNDKKGFKGNYNVKVSPPAALMEMIK